jgi:hypothetical protein
MFQDTLVAVDLDATPSEDHPFPGIGRRPPSDVLPSQVWLDDLSASGVVSNNLFLRRGVDQKRFVKAGCHSAITLFSGELARKLAGEALTLEHEISDLVNAAYGLTPDEIALMWKTAPPRMPIAKPRGAPSDGR